MLYPYMWHPFKNFITTASHYMILAITVERYLVICHERKNLLNPSRNIVAVFLFSLLTSIHKFFEFVHVKERFLKVNKSESRKNQDIHNETDNSYEYQTSLIGENPDFLVFNANHEVFVITFCLLSIFYCNFKICRKIQISGNIQNRY